MKFLIAPVLALSFVCLSLAGCPKGTNPQQVENGVFTVEQVACMVTGFLTNVLATPTEPNEVATIADDVEQVCGIAPALTEDVVEFLNVFVPPPAGADAGAVVVSQKYAAAWAEHAAHKKH
jgi:hypothetical protein